MMKNSWITLSIFVAALSLGIGGCSTLPGNNTYEGKDVAIDIRDSQATLIDQLIVHFLTSVDDDPWVYRYSVKYAVMADPGDAIGTLAHTAKSLCVQSGGQSSTHESKESNSGPAELGTTLLICAKGENVKYALNVALSRSSSGAIWIVIDSFDPQSNLASPIFNDIIYSMIES